MNKFSVKKTTQVLKVWNSPCLLTATILLSADTIANILEPDQARHNVGPDLGPNCLTLRLIVFSEIIFLKISRRQKSMRDKEFIKSLEEAKDQLKRTHT